jgi:hypothetical protein
MLADVFREFNSWRYVSTSEKARIYAMAGLTGSHGYNKPIAMILVRVQQEYKKW